jgi:hypothetical protein
MYKPWIDDSPPSRRRGGRRRRRNRRPDGEQGGSPVNFQKFAPPYCSGGWGTTKLRVRINQISFVVGATWNWSFCLRAYFWLAVRLTNLPLWC